MNSSTRKSNPLLTQGSTRSKTRSRSSIKSCQKLSSRSKTSTSRNRILRKTCRTRTLKESTCSKTRTDSIRWSDRSTTTSRKRLQISATTRFRARLTKMSRTTSWRRRSISMSGTGRISTKSMLLFKNTTRISLTSSGLMIRIRKESEGSADTHASLYFMKYLFFSI